jgi:hypothetical protein
VGEVNGKWKMDKNYKRKIQRVPKNQAWKRRVIHQNGGGTVNMKLSLKVEAIHKKLAELQLDEKPMLAYCRNQLWNGEPCDQCGSTAVPSKVKGRYLAGDSEDQTLLFLCGNCLSQLEEHFAFIME